jgi:hypothetical protein
VTGTITSPPVTPEDHALLEGLELHEGRLCRCNIPIELAWHSDMEGWFDGPEVVCHACSALQGREVTYSRLVNTRPPDDVVPPFVPGVTVTRPTKGPN